MGYLILFIIAIISMSTFAHIAKKTKIPIILLFIILGIMFSTYGVYDLFTKIDEINSNVSELATLGTYAVITLFVVSGLGLDLDAMKKSAKSTIVMSCLPVLAEGIIMGIFSWLFFMIVPLNMFSFSVWEFLTVMAIFAMSAPAVIIPLMMEAKAANVKTKLIDQMSIVSVLDNFTPFPILLIFLNLATTIGVGNNDLSLMGLIIKVLITMAMLVFAYFIGQIYGNIVGIIYNKFTKNVIVMSLLLVVGNLVVVMLTGPIGVSMGIIIGLGTGIGFNMKVEKGEIKGKINLLCQKIYGLLFMPLIFIYVGTQIRVDLLMNPALVISMIIISVVAVCVKGFISMKYLESQGYTKEEQKLSMSLFASKGPILINVSLILAPTFLAAGLDGLLQYMYMLAAISIIITTPYSIVTSRKVLGKL